MSEIEKGVIQSIQARVMRTIPHVPAALRSRFADVLIGKGVLEDELLDELLDAGSTPSQIYHAILICRDEACLQLAPWNRADTTEEQWTSLHQLLSHFDQLYMNLLQAMDTRYRHELERAHRQLVDEGQAHLLSEARSRWTHENEITLYNHYKELPIMAQVDIYAVREHEIVTECNSALYAVITAGEQNKTVRTRLPGQELAVQLIVEEGSRSHIHWRYGGIVDISKEKRNEIRVQSYRPMNIIVSRGKEELLGKVKDLSTQGLGLSLDGRVDLQIGETVDFSMMMHSWEMSGRGEVRWCHPGDAISFAGLKLEYERMSNLRLQAEVVQRQKAIMGELRLHGVPDSIL